MLYLVSFLIIIVFIIETYNSIQVTTQFKESYINTKLNNKFNNNKEYFKNKIETKTETKTGNTDIKKLMSTGFLPANIGDNSNFKLIPSKTNIESLIENEKSGKYKYSYSYPSDIYENEDYFNPIIDIYSKDRTKLPRDWKCQRDWYDCYKDDTYFNKFKTQKQKI